MTYDEAFDCLIEAGLHVRSGNGSFWGGSHVDRSCRSMNMVMNGFALEPNADDTYTYRTSKSNEIIMTLEVAVAHIIKTIKPEKDIPAPPRRITSGPQLY